MSILMKDSGVEWIGDIPENWKVARLKDVININFKSLPSNTEKDFLIKYIEISNVNSMGIISKDDIRELTFDEAPSRAKRIINNGDTIVSSVRPNLQAVAYINEKDTNLICSTGFFTNKIIWNEKHDSKYIYYFLLSEFARQSFISFGKGVGYPAVDDKDYSTLKIVYPIKTEQKQIADFLDKVTLQINDAIKTKEKQLKTLEALKKSIIHKAVTKGLDDSVAMIDSKIEWIGDIPKHWNTKMIKRFAQVKRGASPRPIADQKYFDEDGEFAWVRIADVTASDRYLENTTQRLSELGSQYSVKQYPNDLFISIAGTVGKPIISKIKCCIHDGFVWFDNPTFNKEYLYYIFYADLPYGGLGKLGTQLNLNTDTIGKIYIPVIPNNELPKIVEYLDTEVEKINTLKENVKKQIEKLKEYKKSLIYEYVTGKKQIKG